MLNDMLYVHTCPRSAKWLEQHIVFMVLVHQALANPKQYATARGDSGAVHNNECTRYRVQPPWVRVLRPLCSGVIDKCKHTNDTCQAFGGLPRLALLPITRMSFSGGRGNCPSANAYPIECLQ